MPIHHYEEMNPDAKAIEAQRIREKLARGQGLSKEEEQFYKYITRAVLQVHNGCKI